MKIILKACILCAFAQGIGTAATIFGPGHMDLSLNVSAAGIWTSELQHDGNGSDFDSGPGAGAVNEPANTESVIFVPEERALTRPSSAVWNFLGAEPGGNVWIFPAVQNVNIPFLGLNTETTPSSGLGIWDPAHAAVSSGRWIELRLTNMQYTGNALSPDFSMWTIQSAGSPNVWMNTSNGIATDGTDDVYLMAPGGHSHMNWGFSELGIYDLTFQGSTTLSNNEQSVSDPFTIRFGVGVIPEPGTAALSLITGLLFLLKRRRQSLYIGIDGWACGIGSGHSRTSPRSIIPRCLCFWLFERRLRTRRLQRSTPVMAKKGTSAQTMNQRIFVNKPPMVP